MLIMKTNLLLHLLLFSFIFLGIGCSEESIDLKDEQFSIEENSADVSNLKAEIISDCNEFRFPYPYPHLFRSSTDGDVLGNSCWLDYTIVTGGDTPLNEFFDCRFDIVPPPLDNSVSCSEYIYIPLYKVCAYESPSKPKWWYSFYPAESYNSFDSEYFNSSPDDEIAQVFEEEHFVKMADFAKAKIDESLNGVTYPFMEVDLFSLPYGCSCLDVSGNCVRILNSDGSYTAVCGTKSDVYVRFRGCAYEIGGF